MKMCQFPGWLLSRRVSKFKRIFDVLFINDVIEGLQWFMWKRLDKKHFIFLLVLYKCILGS